MCAGDVLAPPFQPGAFDAVLCLGNTVSLLPDRAAQRRVLAVLGALLRPGGVLVLQGEDAARDVARGPVVRTRRIDAETVHVRLFERRGRRVRMLAGVAPAGGEAPVEETSLLPTTAGSITRSAGHLGLGPVDLPAPPPGRRGVVGGTGKDRGPGSGVRGPGHPPAGRNTKDGMTKVWVRPSVRCRFHPADLESQGDHRQGDDRSETNRPVRRKRISASASPANAFAAAVAAATCRTCPATLTASTV